MKNKSKHLLVLAALAVMVGLCTNRASAQNFNREEARQRMMDGYRTSLEVKSEEDWKKIEPLITKVLDARRAGGGFGFGGGGFGGGGGRRGGGGGDNADQGNRNRGGGGGGGGQQSPEREALQKAIDDKAPAEEVQAKLAKYREARKAKDAANAKALEEAQENLHKALSPRQEAGAVLAGLLK
jgi:hypothetical protein